MATALRSSSSGLSKLPKHAYREAYGDLFSIFELPLIDGWDVQTAQLIEPFITVSKDPSREKITAKKLLNYGKNEVVMRWQRILEEQDGYRPIAPEELATNPNAGYLGSQDRFYARYRYRYGDRISFGFTAEKDPGEEFFRGTQKQGFDFYSGHLFLKDFGKVKRFSLGDYQAQFGQGLTFWSGLGFNRKGSFTVSTAQLGRGIGPYTSINENLFLRGSAVTLTHGNFDVSAFYSGKRIDGNVSEIEADSTDFEQAATVITSFQESGFHRTRNEVEDKNAIFQEHFGGNISYNTERFHVGVTAAHMRLDGAINRRLAEYSQFRFNGTENTVIGGDYLWKIRNFTFFGETTRSANGAWATLNGLNIDMNARLSVNITQRNYDRDFQSVASVGFGEGSLIENESGVYFGVEFRPFKRWKLNAYADHFKFPWLRFQTDAPSSGYDLLAQLEYQPRGSTSIYFRYRDKFKPINTREEVEGVDYLVDQSRRNFRLNASYRASRQVRFRSRIEYTRYNRGAEPLSEGFMVYQDVIYNFKESPLRLTFRYALFDSDTYDARLYAYENDVLYSFSIPAYNGRGSRVYAILKYRIGRWANIWLRWAQFYYTDRNEVGTGREAIAGNTRTEVKAQLQIKF
ncbi:MAG: hypothetical protein LC664_06360 [Flavobacteriales bacterium]|nr:hypothetical protein [Flavobacteriales bacterium]